MAQIRGWAKLLNRAKTTHARLSSYGMSFNQLGGKPQSASMCFAYSDQNLEIELGVDEVQKLVQSFSDFLARSK